MQRMSDAPAVSGAAPAPTDRGRTDASADVIVEHTATFRFVKRTLDIVLSLVLLVLTVVLFVAVALVIMIRDQGPVFFTQTRIGRDGKPFTLIKFRTMAPDTTEVLAADAELRRRFVENGYKLAPDDPRITPVGRFLRRTSLDELPQLLNVLGGQMSLVGIRPLVQQEYLERSQEDRELYAGLRPGLTGLWQVEGRSRLSTDRRLDLDRAYARTCSTWVDVKILARTPIALLRTNESH